MAKILSQEEIDALLSNVSGEPESVQDAESAQKITLYDFKHPNLVSKEQMRLLENIHEGLCRNFGVFLSAQLRMIVEMNLLAIDQIMYSEFVMSIAPPTCIYVGGIDAPPGQFVLEMNPQLAVLIVERLFGGRGSLIPNVRPISIIEQKVMMRVVGRIAAELSKNWNPLAHFNVSIDRFESNPEFVQIVPSSEPVVVVSMEIKIHGHSTLMNICYPYMWISNIVSLPDVQEKILFGTKESTEEEKMVLEQNLLFSRIMMRAVLGKSVISVRDFVDLKVGDVIRLQNRTTQMSQVYAHKKHFFNAVVGTRNKRLAFRITSVIEGEEDEESS